MTYFRFDHHHQSFSSISFLPSLLRVFETLKSIINHHFFAFPRSNCYFRKCWKIDIAFYNVLQTRETIHRILSIPPRFLLIESTNLGVVSRSIKYIVHNRSLPSTKSHERFAIDSILSQCNNDDDDVDDDESKPVAINFLRRSDRIEPARPTLSAEHPRICGNARTCGTRDVTASSSAYLRSGTRNCGAVQGRPARPLPLCVIFRRSSLDKLSLYTAVTGAPLVPSFPLFPPRRHYIIYTPLENPPSLARASSPPILKQPIIDAFLCVCSTSIRDFHAQACLFAILGHS